MISFKGISKSYKFWLESSRNYKYVTLTWNIYFLYQTSLSIIISFNLSFNIFFHFFQNFLVSSSLHLSKSFCSKLSLPRKVLSSKTCAIHLFHSPLPLSKRIRQGLTAWILFVSLFSLFQKNEGLTAWILCVSLLPCQRIQNDTVWEFFWFFPFSYTKDLKEKPPENSFVSPFKKFQRFNCLRILR